MTQQTPLLSSFIFSHTHTQPTQRSFQIKNTKGLFGIVFGRFKSAFNTQKARLIKKLKALFKNLKSLKIAKKHFW
jgi:hypothetical protein